MLMAIRNDARVRGLYPIKLHSRPCLCISRKESGRGWFTGQKREWERVVYGDGEFGVDGE
jgi:hypothetical protein